MSSPCKFSILGAILGIGLFIHGSGPALASTVQTFAIDSTGTASQNIDFSAFDSSLGTLNDVTFTLSDSNPVENSSVTTSFFAPFPTSYTGSMSARFRVRGPGSGGPSAVVLFSGTGVAYSACTDFGFGCSSSGNSSTTPPTFNNSFVVTDPADLASYEDVGTFSLVVSAQLTNPSCSGPQCQAGASASWAGTITVSYDYTAAPEPASMGLMASGLGLFGLLRRRRRAARS